MTTLDTNYLRFAMFNGAVVATDALKVSPLGSGFMFGEGVFETVRVQDSRSILLDAHHARLTASVGSFGAAPTSSLSELQGRCRQVITANSLVSGSVKIVVFKDTVGWSEMILARSATYAAERYKTGFRVQTVPCDQRIGALHALKSLNYLPNIRAKRSAVAAGFDEAVFFNPQGHVLEGATTNVFIVKDGVIGTPPLKSGILPGVMRARVIQMLGPAAIRECDVTLDELLQADEVFVTNTLLGVMPVALVDATTYDLGGNTTTRSLMAADPSK